MRESDNKLSLKRIHQKRRVVLIITAAIVVILVMAGVLFVIYKKTVGRDSGNSVKPETSINRTTSEKGLPGSDYATGSTDTPTPVHPQGDSDSSPPAEQGRPTIEISNFSQNDSTVDVRVALSNIKSAGKCIFTFSKDNAKSVVRESNSDGKTCSTFAKSTEFSKLDIWTLNIAFYAASRKIVDTTLNVTIN